MALARSRHLARLMGSLLVMVGVLAISLKPKGV